MSESGDPANRDSISPDDALPPVEPPSARFILQLFVVPGVIVLVIVLVWLLFTWVASKGDDPKQYVAALKRPGPGQWQAASNLANALRNKRHEQFKSDHKAAEELATILKLDMKREKSEGGLDKNAITLRMFLCRALGEFYVDDGLEVLLQAAVTQRSDEEVDVRRSAIEGIALLAENLRQAKPPSELEHPQLDPTMEKLAKDDNPLIRYVTAYALGVLGGEENILRLEAMALDANADVRYNAATGLSRAGNEKAIPLLVEMLDPEQTAGLETEKDKQMQESKQALIMVNALRAAKLLQDKNPEADMTPVTKAITKLLASDVHRQILVQSQEALKELQNVGKAGSKN